jgi:hypothetical protein
MLVKWTEDQVVRLNELCFQGVSNKEIAASLGCRPEDIYHKRSQLGITIDKCKGVQPEPEKAVKKTPGGLCKDVKEAFKKLRNEVLVAMVRDWRPEKETQVYYVLANMVYSMESSFDELLKL